MAEIPTHPETGSGAMTEAHAGRPRWRSALWVALVVAVVALFIVLHLTGVVGADSHK